MENNVTLLTAQLLAKFVCQLRILLDSGAYSPGSRTLDAFLTEKNEGEVFFVSNDDDKVTGAIFGRFVFETADLDYLIVDSLYYGTRVANELLLHFCAAAKESKCERVLLEVGVLNHKAISFYTRHGFREIARRRNYYASTEDALVLQKELM